MDSADFQQIPTKASRGLDTDSAFEVVVHTRKPKSGKTNEGTVKSDVIATKLPEKETFEFSRARHEVIRFGTAGLDTAEKKNAQIALAIKLGAKPPKRPSKSYKDLQEERRAAKEKETKDGQQQKLLNHHQLHPNHLIAANLRRKHKRMDAQDTIRDYGVVDKTARK